ncbi:unnamed protein product [Polarella glacialis]|nr:unnamed protein product [Polarella glacialis]
MSSASSSAFAAAGGLAAPRSPAAPLSSASPQVRPAALLEAAPSSSSSSSGRLLAAGLALGALASAKKLRGVAGLRASGSRAGRRSAVARMANTPVVAGIVITGGAAGVGYAYADEFVKRGHRVVICDIKDPSTAVNAIRKKYEHQAAVTGTIDGTMCDVSELDSINQLVDFAKQKIGTVHYWINNAGINGSRRRFTEIDARTIEAVVKVNLGGILLCTHAAMRMMEEQKGVTGHVFNTVGSGVKGGGTPGYVAYGATKRGLPQMTDSLVAEIEKGVQGYDIEPTPGKACCHVLSPGMVFTDLLLNDSTPELRKFPFGVLAAQPEEVALDLVPKILKVSGNGKSLEFLTPDKILGKFFQRFALGQKSEYIDDDGNVIKVPGAQYNDSGVRILYDGMVGGSGR